MNNDHIRYLITYLTEWQERAIRQPVVYTLTILEQMKREELIRVMSISENVSENKERVIDFIMDTTSLHHSFTNRFVNRK
jgi:hypothetical protein